MHDQDLFIPGVSPDDLTERLSAVLGKSFALNLDEPVRGSRRRFDTFDFDLGSAGATLEGMARDRKVELLMRAPGRSPIEGTARSWPRFPGDLGSALLAERLAALTGQRALLEISALDGRVTCGGVRDRDGKTRVRVEIWEHRGSDRVVVLRLRALQGYQAVFARLARRLATRGAESITDPLDDGPAPAWLRRRGERPPVPSRPPEQRADEACKAFLREQLAMMEDTQWGVVEQVDVEFLHDYRVAVRRSRSLLRELRTVFPASTHARAVRDFAWLGEITGPPRDLDVQIEALAAQRGWIPRGMRAALDPLDRALRAERDAVRTVLNAALRSRRYDLLLERWSRFLDAPLPRRPGAAHARAPIGALAGKRLRRLHRKILKDGGAIDDETADEALHDLRKTCKRLRYLLEFVRPSRPAQAGPLVKRLKVLQENLGAFQDLCVERETLHRHAAEIGFDAPGRVALDRFQEALILRSGAARRDFAGRFARFASASTRRRFAALDESLQPAGGD